jgi:hypothetical protein
MVWRCSSTGGNFIFDVGYFYSVYYQASRFSE